VCFSSTPKAPATTVPSYVHNPYLDGGAYGNTVDSNRVGTSALTIGLDPNSGNRAGINDPNPRPLASTLGLAPGTYNNLNAGAGNGAPAGGIGSGTGGQPNPGAAGSGNGGGGVRGINR